MSFLKAWKVDVRQARDRARAAAGNADPGTRMHAFGQVCSELGEAANAYADPLRAARVLVHIAAAEYVAERKGAMRMSEGKTNKIVDTTELRAGDVVLTHGMRLLLTGDPQVTPGAYGGVYGWTGLVTNLEEVKAAGIVPVGWLYPDKWGAGENGGWGKDWAAEPSWRVQGNSLATWIIERKAEES